MAKSIADVTTKIFEQLKELAAEERLRVVNAALTLLGDPVLGMGQQRRKDEAEEKGGRGEDTVDGICEKAAAWIRKSGIEADALEEVFHVDGGKVELIGDAVGKSKRQQTVNTYLLTGVAAFLATGTPEFADDVARNYCQHFGCYDSPNHSNY